MTLDMFGSMFEQFYKPRAVEKGWTMMIHSSPLQPLLVISVMDSMGYTVAHKVHSQDMVLAHPMESFAAGIWSWLEAEMAKSPHNPTLKQTMEQLSYLVMEKTHQETIKGGKLTGDITISTNPYYAWSGDAYPQYNSNISSGTIKVYGLDTATKGTEPEVISSKKFYNPAKSILFEMAKWEETAPKTLTELYGGVDWDQLWVSEGKHKKSKGSLKIKVQPKTAAQLQAAAKVEAQLKEMNQVTLSHVFAESPLLKYITSKT